MLRLAHRYLLTVGAAASVIAVILFFVRDPARLNIALAFLLVTSTLVGVRAYLTLHAIAARSHPEPYQNLASISRYATQDGRAIVYELHKVIQCKRPMLFDYRHEYRWTGSRQPSRKDIESDTMTIVRRNRPDVDGVGSVEFRFRRPLIYDEAALIHFLLRLDDSDHKSSTHVQCKVKEPMQFLSFEVELGHVERCDHAQFCRRRILAQAAIEFEALKSVPFDPRTRTFRHHENNPEPGYYYRLQWKDLERQERNAGLG